MATISLKIINLSSVADKKVYYKVNEHFVGITDPEFSLTVTKYGVQADYHTGHGKKLCTDFYVKSADGRTMEHVQLIDRNITVTARNELNGKETIVTVQAIRHDDNTLELYVPLFTSNGVVEPTTFSIPCGTYKCKTNGFTEYDSYADIGANVGLIANRDGFVDSESAEFFSSLDVEGEDRVPSYAEKVILTADEAKKATQIIKKAFADLKKMGVMVCYDDHYGHLQLIKGTKEKYKGGESSDAKEDEIFIPDAAYTAVTQDVAPIAYLGEVWGQIMKK